MYVSLEEYNAFFEENLTEQEFEKFQTLAILKLNELIGTFPTVEQFNSLNEISKTALTYAIMYEIKHISENGEWFFNNENAYTNSITLGRFSISENPVNSDVEDVPSIVIDYLTPLGVLKTRAVGC